MDGSITSQFLLDFFPHGAALLARHTRLWQVIAQPWGARVCRAAEALMRLPLHGAAPIAVRNPSLALLCVAGVAVALQAWRCRARTLWGKAFLAYAAMNASALLCHSLVPHASPLHGALRGADVAATFVSSASLMAATSTRDHPKAASKLLSVWLRAAVAAVALAVAGNLGPMPLPWLNEGMYAITTLAAFALLLRREVFGRRREGGAPRHWINAAGAAAGLGAAAVPAEPLLCTLCGPHFVSVHMFFLGCTSAMACLHMHLSLQEAAPAVPRRVRPAGWGKLQ